MTEKIAVVTTTRADWDLLSPLIRALIGQGAEVRIAVTGSHLSPAFGMTVDDIEKGEFNIDRCIPILDEGGKELEESIVTANAILEFSRYFSETRPDCVVLLGDRYETLGIAQAAFSSRIPIVHLHGGEKTTGAIDDCIRHCITKLSNLHLTSTDEYRHRVIQLGEQPESVINVGSIGVENTKKTELMSLEQLADSLGLEGLAEFCVFTYHPETLASLSAEDQIARVLAAFDEANDLTILATKANHDAGGMAVNRALEEYASTHDNFVLSPSLGMLRYLTALKHARFVIGNSSSGIIEAPSFHIPTVNIGMRQAGRARAESVIDCVCDTESIKEAIRKADNPHFRRRALTASNPYEKEDAAENSAGIIVQWVNEKPIQAKEFHDIEFNE